MGTAIKTLALISACAVLFCILLISVRFAYTLTPASIDTDTSHNELVTILLTGLTVSIAVLALVIAILAVVGYQAIRSEAKKSAGAQARAATARFLQSKEGRDLILSEIRPIAEEQATYIREGIEISLSQMMPQTSTMKTSEDSEKLGKIRRRNDDDEGAG